MMNDSLNRITFNKEIMGGKPLIRNLRISVEMILQLLAQGSRRDEILEDYPELEPDDINAALYYAHYMVSGERVFEHVTL